MRNEEMVSQDEEDSTHLGTAVDNTTGQTEMYLTEDLLSEETQTNTQQTETHIQQTEAHTQQTETYTQQTETHIQQTEAHTQQTETYTQQTETHTPHTETQAPQTETHTNIEDSSEETCTSEDEEYLSDSAPITSTIQQNVDFAGQTLCINDFLPTVSSCDETLNKYWSQRFRLFSLYDQGIRMDHG